MWVCFSCILTYLKFKNICDHKGYPIAGIGMACTQKYSILFHLTDYAFQDLEMVKIFKEKNYCARMQGLDA